MSEFAVTTNTPQSSVTTTPGTTTPGAEASGNEWWRPDSLKQYLGIGSDLTNFANSLYEIFSGNSSSDLQREYQYQSALYTYQQKQAQQTTKIVLVAALVVIVGIITTVVIMRKK